MKKQNTGLFSRRKMISLAAALGVLGAGAGLYRFFSSSSRIDVDSFSTKGSGERKNILVLTGSARRDGNSALLAQAFVKGAQSAGHTVTTFAAGQNAMSGCLNCNRCWSTGRPCVINDNFSRLAPLLEEATLLVLVSPLYWYNMSGQIKCAIDRFYPWSRPNRPRNLKITEAMLLMCGESHFPRSFAAPAESYRQILGLKRWRDRGRLFATGVLEYGAIRNNSALEKAEEMGRDA